MSLGSRSIRRGQTRSRFTLFESAPASKSSQSECRLSAVRQMMPNLQASNFVETSTDQRAPLSMSAVDRKGLTAFITFGNQSCSASAIFRLRSPDQLMKTSTVPSFHAERCLCRPLATNSHVFLAEVPPRSWPRTKPGRQLERGRTASGPAQVAGCERDPGSTNHRSLPSYRLS